VCVISAGSIFYFDGCSPITIIILLVVSPFWFSSCSGEQERQEERRKKVYKFHLLDVAGHNKHREKYKTGRSGRTTTMASYA
jgi:hypothetical protein